jgi:hypothetical protein
MSEILENAKRLKAHVERLRQAGAGVVKESKTMTPEAGIFYALFDPWEPDGGTSRAGEVVRHNGAAYQAVTDIQRIEAYAPDQATNNWNPYPAPDVDGIYPYVYGMGIKPGMRVRDESGRVYTAIQGAVKLAHAPADVPAILQAES